MGVCMCMCTCVWVCVCLCARAHVSMLYVHVCVVVYVYVFYVCMCVHVCICVLCVGVLCPLHGGHGNTSSACLMMCLMAAPLSLTMWWRPSGVRGTSHWSCKPTMGDSSCIHFIQCTRRCLHLDRVFWPRFLLFSVTYPPFWEFFCLA